MGMHYNINSSKPIGQIAQDLKIKKEKVSTLLKILQNNMPEGEFSIITMAKFLLQDFYTKPKIQQQSILINNGIEEKLVNRFYEALQGPVTAGDPWKYITTKKTMEDLIPVLNRHQ